MTKNDQGWVPLAVPPNRQRIILAALASLPVLILMVQTAYWIPRLFVARFYPDQLIASVAAFVLMLAVFLLVVYLLNPVPYVNVGEGKLRVGRRRISFNEVSRASVTMVGTLRRPSLVLALGGAKGLKGSVFLRDAYDRPLPERARDLLLTVLRESSIAAPSSPYDPDRKFTEYNFPGQLEKDAVITLVENNPSVRQPIPGITPAQPFR